MCLQESSRREGDELENHQTTEAVGNSPLEAYKVLVVQTGLLISSTLRQRDMVRPMGEGA